MSAPLALLQQRHSAPSRQLGEPAPAGDPLRELLQASLRVPDHGKLAPFRLIQIDGEAKRHFGERLVELALARDPQLSDARLEKERGRYAFAPLVIVVVASIDTQSSVPPVEQVLSAGCVAHNLLLGTYALGYGAQWLTGWAAYDPQVAALLGLGSHEQVIGFVHIGTPRIEVPDRERPALADVLVHWQP